MNVNLFAHFGLGLHGREILPDQVEEPHVQPIAPPAEPAAVEPPEPLPMASGNFYLPVKTRVPKMQREVHRREVNKN